MAGKDHRSKLLALGIDPDIKQYGMVLWWEPFYWNGFGTEGKGRIRLFSPYLRNHSSWLGLDVFRFGIQSNKFHPGIDPTLNKNDFVGFDVDYGHDGLMAVNVSVLQENVTDRYVEHSVTKALNFWRDAGYVTPFSHPEELDFFGGKLEVLESMSSLIETEEELPTIKKAPADEQE